jgi:uncharacterized membrane protein YdfJ with MMPL/SSD domain
LSSRFPPQQNGPNPIVFHVDTGKLTDKANKDAIKSSVQAMRKTPHVYSVTNPVTNNGQTAGLLSKDKQTAFAPVLLDVNSATLNEEIAQKVFDGTKPAKDAGIQVAAAASIGSELSTESTESSELVGIIAAMFILTLVLGSLIAMGMPIIAAIVGLAVALGIVGLLGHLLSIPDTGATLATMIGLGVGIDYALFLISRHQDQLAEGMAMEHSIARAVATSGSAIIFAGGTVVAALLSLRVAGIPLLSSLGVASAVAVVTAVLGAITLLPAVLGLLAHRIAWLHLPSFSRKKKSEASPASGQPAQSAHGRLWGSWAGFVARHPLVVALASLAVVAPLVIPALSLRFGQEDVGAAPKSTTERQAYDLISAGFGPGYNGPLQVASKFDPVVKPSQEYTNKYNKATSLQKDLEHKQKTLPKQQKQLEKQEKQLEQQQNQLDAQQKQLVAQQQSLENQQASLEQRKNQLVADQASLERQQASLQQQGVALQKKGKQLQAQKAALLRKENILKGKEAKLQAKADRLQTKIRALAAQIRPLARQLAILLARERVLNRRIDKNAGNPVRLAILQARLATVEAQIPPVRAALAPLKADARVLARQAQALNNQKAKLTAEGNALQRQANQLTAEGNQLEAQKAALQREAASLKQQGAALQREGDQLQQQGAQLQSEGAALQQQGAQLQHEAGLLQQQGNALQKQGDQLKQEQKQAKQEQKQAEQLQNQLTKMVTKAGGDPRNTDPRVVDLQNALSATSGVTSLTPPQTNKKGDVVLLSAVPTTGPATVATTKVLSQVRDDAIPGIEKQGGITSYVGGYTASYVDLASLISQRLLLVIGTVIMLGFLLLMLAFRSLLIPLQAALTNLLSAAAAFGILTACFQWGWGVSLVGIDTDSTGVPIASYVPLMMFAVLFGLSMDYEVFLVSHIQMHHAEGEPARKAAADGLTSSARITTAACLIMTSVFASFILNGDPTIKQFGVGLASAVLLAGILVITLAPAAIVLMGEAAWWVPRFLDKVLPHMHLEGEPEPKGPTPPPMVPLPVDLPGQRAPEEPAQEPTRQTRPGP